MARHNLRSDSLSILRRWWTEKYKLSQKSEEFLSYTFFELLTEFFEDFYSADKTRMWKDEKSKYGTVKLPKIGDSFVDRWNAQIEQGIDPDLTEGMLPEEREKVRQKIIELEKKQAVKETGVMDNKLDKFFSNKTPVQEVEEFSDYYSKD